MNFLDKTKKTLIDNKPEILTTMGCVGVVSTAGLAIQATPYAMDAMDRVKAETEKKQQVKKFVTDVVPCYIPTIVSGVASITCIILSHKEMSKRNLITAGLCAASERTLKTYQEKVIEHIGEKKEREIRDDIAKDKLKTNPMNETNVIVTGRDAHWVYDSYSGRYFKCDLETIRKTVNDVNQQITREMSATLNDFYWGIGVEPLRQGDNVGWSGDTGYLDVQFSAQLNENGEPCIVIDYTVHTLYS